MRNNTNSPLNVICRELHRLESDPDRLQMMVTLRSRLAHLQFASSHFQLVLSNFQTEEYRWQAIQQILPYIQPTITPDSVTALVELFARREYRSNLIELLKNFESLKANQALNEKLRQEYRPDVHSIVAKSEEHLPMPEHQQDAESNMPKALTSSSGVFEKAKQFVCRVFGSGSYSSSSGLDDSPKKRLMTDDQHERKRLHVAEDERESFIGNDDKIEQQSHPASCSLTLSRSYVSLVNECPPPSPTSPHTTIHLTEDILADLNTTLRNQLPDKDPEQTIPVPDESNMVIQIHCILDNIDSVLDKIEAHASSASHRSAFTETHPTAQSSESNVDPDEESARTLGHQSTDRVTQTAIGIIEQHTIVNDGSGDTPTALLDLLDVVDESSSIFSSDESEDSID